MIFLKEYNFDTWILCTKIFTSPIFQVSWSSCLVFFISLAQEMYLEATGSIMAYFMHELVYESFGIQ